MAPLCTVGGGRSQPVNAGLKADDDQIQNVRLVLEPTTLARIRVRDDRGHTLPQTYVMLAFLSDSLVRSTDASGIAEFQLTTAQKAAPVNVVLTDIRSSLACARVLLDGEREVRMPSSGGEARLVRAGAWKMLPQDTRPWLVSSEGCAVPFLGVRHESAGEGQSVAVFPNLAVGRWTYVETYSDGEAQALLSGAAMNRQFGPTFTVEAGKRTGVRVDAELEVE